MKTKIFFILSVILIVANVVAYAANTDYHLLRKIPLGGTGGWDYASVDDAARRLYVSRGTHVMVLDLTDDKVIGDIAPAPGVHGIAFAPEFNRGFISNGRDNSVTIFDLKTLKILDKVNVGTNPDAIIYDPASKRVFTFNGQSSDATVLDTVSGKVVANIPLGGKPEFAASDNSGKVFVNIEDTSEVVEIDSVKAKAVRRFLLTPGVEPTGMSFDLKNKLIFSVCHNKLLVVLNAISGKVVSTVPIGEGVDACAFDAKAGLIFASNGDGTLTVIKEVLPNKFTVMQNVATQHGSRTMALDPKSHRVYLPAAIFSKTEKEAMPNGRKHPAMIKDSFSIIVVGR
jgi:YVTN family beta-propeller protein